MGLRRVITATFLLVSAGCAAAPQVDLDAETAAVTARSEALAHAEAAKDAQAAASFWAEPAIVQPAGGPQIQGRQAVLDGYRQFFGALKEFEGTSTGIDISAAGDMAWDYGVNRLVFSTPNGDVVDNGKYIAVWKKIDNEWYVVAVSFSSDAPAPQQADAQP
jgi:ketosteroid isomerase-like protein